jgi:hypothetical protein
VSGDESNNGAWDAGELTRLKSKAQQANSIPTRSSQSAFSINAEK